MLAKIINATKAEVFFMMFLFIFVFLQVLVRCDYFVNILTQLNVLVERYTYLYVDEILWSVKKSTSDPEEPTSPINPHCNKGRFSTINAETSWFKMIAGVSDG